MCLREVRKLGHTREVSSSFLCGGFTSASLQACPGDLLPSASAGWLCVNPLERHKASGTVDFAPHSNEGVLEAGHGHLVDGSCVHTKSSLCSYCHF